MNALLEQIKVKTDEYRLIEHMDDLNLIDGFVRKELMRGIRVKTIPLMREAVEQGLRYEH